MRSFSVERFRQQFPIFNQVSANDIVYFDNAATTQKPACVIDASSHYYQTANANVHRASHKLSALATQLFEQARATVQHFINAKSCQEIIWTKGTTEGINLIAQTYAAQHLKPGDEIVLSYAEHHANIVPWQEVAKRTNANLKVLELDDEGRIDISAVEQVITDKTAIVSVALISNVIGKSNTLDAVIKRAREVGAAVIVDAAQAVAHQKIDVQALDCDFLVFSGHKMFGPTGVGVLYGKFELLKNMPPYQFGGEMIKKVSFSGTSYGEAPLKFEAGTPNIVGAVGLSAAIEFLQHHIEQGMLTYELKLLAYAYQALSSISDVNWLFSGCPDIPVFSFTLKGHHNQDVASFLNEQHIAIRAGHHCAMPLMEYKESQGCIRVSLSPYNTYQEVDTLVNCLKDYLTAAAEQSQQSVDETQSIQEAFSKASGWDGKHRAIMLLGKTLERMPKSMRSPSSLIDGCESDAWLVASKTAKDVWQFQADSDAKIIRGLLVVILAAYQGKCSQEIIDYDIEGYFENLGLMGHLSPSRGNGVRAIVARIQQLVSC